MSLHIYVVSYDGQLEADLTSTEADAFHWTARDIQQRYPDFDLSSAANEDELRELLLDFDLPIDFLIQEIKTPTEAIAHVRERLEAGSENVAVRREVLEQILEFLS